MGRPKLAPSAVRDKVVHLRLTEAGLRAVEQQASDRNKTVSEHIRDVLRAYTLGAVKLS